MRRVISDDLSDIDHIFTRDSTLDHYAVVREGEPAPVRRFGGIVKTCYAAEFDASSRAMFK